jgi:hypothetical protein
MVYLLLATMKKKTSFHIFQLSGEFFSNSRENTLISLIADCGYMRLCACNTQQLFSSSLGKCILEIIDVDGFVCEK